jgi:4-hydroxythreonine-4-phosphate dehydrogenase
MNEKPTVALPLGDPAGIGPELIAKLASRKDLMSLANAVVIGDRWLWDEGLRIANVKLELTEIGTFADAASHNGPFPVLLPVDTVNRRDVKAAAACAASGKSVIEVLGRCLAAATAGQVDAICFGPLNKLAMKMGGLPFSDELHYFAHELKVDGFFCELNVLWPVWTSRITSHIPLKDVAAAVDGESIKKAARLIHSALLRAGYEKPRIAVAGLNPHAGEGGTCGREEIDIIAPAVRQLRAEGVPADGPFSADTIFIKAFAKQYDAVVTMYHDQGQIALKLMGFDRGVTVQGGLPVVITTPAHGTAFDIAGTNKADPGATIQAYTIALKMAGCRDV